MRFSARRSKRCVKNAPSIRPSTDAMNTHSISTLVNSQKYSSM